jgi:hypothetical protein
MIFLLTLWVFGNVGLVNLTKLSLRENIPREGILKVQIRLLVAPNVGRNLLLMFNVWLAVIREMLIEIME